MTTQADGRPTLREQQLKLREDVILREVNALLAEKGYDLMTVDEVAARVGIAKPSLYKHFESKEALAAAALVRLLERTRDAIEAQPASAPALDKLKGVVRWALREHLDGQMPSLPSTRSALRESLVRHPGYVDLLIEVSERLGAWIEEAQRRKVIAPRPAAGSRALHALRARVRSGVRLPEARPAFTRTTRSSNWSRPPASTDWPRAAADRTRRTAVFLGGEPLRGRLAEDRVRDRQARLQAVFVEPVAGPRAGEPHLPASLRIREAALRGDRGAVEDRVRVVELGDHLCPRRGSVIGFSVSSTGVSKGSGCNLFSRYVTDTFGSRPPSLM